MKRSRERILAAAEEVFLEAGFAGTNMDAVSDRAGVSKQTVYAHFKSKEALFIRVVEEMTGGAASALREDVEDPLDDRPIEPLLLDLAREQLAVVMTPRLMRLRRMVIAEVDRFPDLGRSLYKSGPGKSIAKLTRIVQHYTTLGELCAPDAEMAATHFNWILMGAPTNAAMLLGDTGIPDEAALQAHAHESVRIFLAAYGPRPPS